MNDAEKDPTVAPKYPLANDAEGNPIDVPPEAVAWRVRKLAKKAGRPKVVFDAETGRALELALPIGYDEFAETIGESGRFRLEAIDAQGRLIAGCVAVTEVAVEETEVPASNDATPHLLSLIGQLVQTNARVMEAMASAFGQVRPTEPVVIQQQPAGPQQPSISEIPAILSMIMQQFGGQKPNPAPTPTPANGGTQS